jgi:hypothetical protein
VKEDKEEEKIIPNKSDSMSKRRNTIGYGCI